MFGKRAFIDPDIDLFHIGCWVWLLRQTGGIEQFRETALILPNADFFPTTDYVGHNLAAYIFDIVRDYSGLQDWPIELHPQDPQFEEMPIIGAVQESGGPAGTFSHNGESGIITYDPAQLAKPMSLVATFAHELGHYLNGGFSEPPPGGWDLMEPATDVTAAFLGFGIFGANAAFNHEQWSDNELSGWSTNRLGYIGEDAWALNLALFCALQGRSFQELKPYLKAYIYKDVKKASKYLSKRGTVSEIVKEVQA